MGTIPAKLAVRIADGTGSILVEGVVSTGVATVDEQLEGGAS